MMDKSELGNFAAFAAMLTEDSTAFIKLLIRVAIGGLKKFLPVVRQDEDELPHPVRLPCHPCWHLCAAAQQGKYHLHPWRIGGDHRSGWKDNGESKQRPLQQHFHLQVQKHPLCKTLPSLPAGRNLKTIKPTVQQRPDLSILIRRTIGTQYKT